MASKGHYAAKRHTDDKAHCPACGVIVGCGERTGTFPFFQAVGQVLNLIFSHKNSR
jgi:hypothetical protein